MMKEAIIFFTTFKTIKLLCTFCQMDDSKLRRYFVFKIHNNFLLIIEESDIVTGNTTVKSMRTNNQYIAELKKDNCFWFDVQLIISENEENLISFDKLEIYNDCVKFTKKVPIAKIDEKELNSKLIS